MLQSENIDVSSAIEMIVKTRQAMVEMRSDEVFQQALVDEHDLCNSIDIEAEFQEPELRPLKKKKQYDYESLEQVPPKEIQAKLLFFILDVTINSMQKLFGELDVIYEKTDFYLASRKRNTIKF
ncbi:hypothetical protein AVEN_115367-1 [Araneus ventricosus]|uniref:Uncharacterized protein n=1 Tax=Araneus ventricosus TaxID=182803 RepID=A0A4Y1ZYT7_ARAVE|nr:hypothetical protein AVEN_115367-1 [Araneus ventricosus]